MVLFLAIAALILIGWPIVSQSLFPQPTRPRIAQTPPGASPVAAPTGTAGSNATAPAVDATRVKRPRAAVLAETPRVMIDTPAVKGSINLKGARLDDLVLVRHRETIKKNALPIRLLSPSGAADSYFAGFGWAGDGVALPDKNTLWTADSAVLAPGRPVTLSWANPQGLRFQIKIAVDEGYLFTIEQSAANASAAPVTQRLSDVICASAMVMISADRTKSVLIAPATRSASRCAASRLSGAGPRWASGRIRCRIFSAPSKHR